MAIDFEKNKWNLFSLVYIMISFVGVWWLNVNKVTAGVTYFGIVIFIISSILFITMALKEQRKENNLYIPIDTSATRGIIKFTLGILTPVVFAIFIPKLIQLLNPKFIFDVFGQQSFAAIQQMEMPFWQWFTTGFTAGIIEELWKVALFLNGMVLGLYISNALNIKKAFARLSIQVICALIVSAGIFTITHQLNPIYVTSAMFISALIFSLIMSIVQYFLLGYEYTAGYHIANNTIWLGPAIFLPAMANPFGILILFIFLIGIYWVLRAKKQEKLAPVIKEWAFLPGNNSYLK